MIPVFLRRFVLLLTLSGACSGCALLGPAPRADVSLVNMEFTNVTLFETTAQVTIRIQNQNPDPVRVEGGVHSLSINGTELGSGTTSEYLDLPPFQSGTQTLTLHLSNIAMLSKIKSLVESKRFQYEIESEIPVRRDGIRRSVDVSRSGSVTPDDFQSLTQ